MKLNIVLLIASSVLIYFLMSSENKNDKTVIQKIGNMIHQYEHNQKIKKEKRIIKEFDCTINNNQLVHENAGIMECPKE